MIENAAALATAHWQYIETLLIAHGENARVIELIGFHYQSAMIHGYKHGYADAQSAQGAPND